jgi:xanthine/uracil permease
MAPCHDRRKNLYVAALQVASGLGPAGAPLAQAARTAFIDGMASGMLIAELVAFAGAILVLLFLPAHARRAAGTDT